MLRKTLSDLDRSLTGKEGPYILSDLLWNNGPLYVRYGGFTAQFMTDEGGGKRETAGYL
jgi:hypothetical protein